MTRPLGYLLSALVVAASVSTCSHDGAEVMLAPPMEFYVRFGVLAFVVLIASVDWGRGRDR